MSITRRNKRKRDKEALKSLTKSYSGIDRTFMRRVTIAAMRQVRLEQNKGKATKGSTT